MATAAPGGDAAAPKGKKKLIIMIAAILLVVLVGGGAAVIMMKKKAAAADEEGADDHAPAAHLKVDPKHPPIFLPLDPFTVNLADKEADRFAQVGITLEVVDQATGDQMKAFMPAIRSNVLMILAHKTSAELLSLEGKEKLSREILRASVLPMGVELDPEDDEAPADEAPKKKKKKKAAQASPVLKVHFSNFIIQ